MEFSILGLFLIMGFFILYFIFLAPKPDLVFTSASDEEILHVKGYLEENGIKVYIKGMDMQRFHETAYDLVNPSLHVVRPEDRLRALGLIENLKRSTRPPNINPL